MSQGTEQLLEMKDAEIEALRNALATLQEKHSKALELLQEVQDALQNEQPVEDAGDYLP